MQRKIICLDFDDVITDENIFSKMISMSHNRFKGLGIGLEFLAREDNMHPKKFYKFLKKCVMLGKGLSFGNIEKIENTIGLTTGAAKTFSLLMKRDYKIIIISTNDRKIIKGFLKKNKIEKYIDHIYAAKLGVKNGKLTGKISGDVLKGEKTGIVKNIERQYNTKRENIIYVGDGLTDLPIMKLVGRGILFCPTSITRAEVYTDKILSRKEKDGKLFLVEKRNLMEIMKFL
ncbi:MAG: HAD-IB family phosphatase [Candidatus Aenigmatarchaeota archaeon]